MHKITTLASPMTHPPLEPALAAVKTGFPLARLRSLEIHLLLLVVAICAGCSTVPRPGAARSHASAKVAFENQRVRVIEYDSGSEKDVCGVGMHSHPAHLYIQLTDAKLRIVTPDGKESFENSKAGDIGWEPAERHIAETVGKSESRCYVIEIKDKNWKPSTGLTR